MIPDPFSVQALDVRLLGMEWEKEEQKRKGVWIGVLILMGVALALRLWGNRFGLPWIEAPDPDSVVLAKNLAREAVGPERLLKPTRYPHLLVYLYYPLFKLFPELSIVWLGRIVSAVLGAGTVGWVYLCGKAAAGRRAGVLAALWVCFSFLAVQHGHTIKPHVPVAFFSTACLYFCMQMIKRPNIRVYCMAGLTGGAALATLHSGIVLLAALGAAAIMAPGNGGRLSWRRYLGPGPLALCGLLLAFFILGYPNRIGPLAEIIKGEAGWSALMAPHVPGTSQSLGLIGLSQFILYLVHYDPFVGILGFLALVWGVWKRNTWWRLCLPGFAMVILFIALFGHLQSLMPRFLILILPPLSVAAAAWVEAGCRKLRPATARVAVWALFPLLILPGAAVVARLEWLFVQEDTRTQAVQWIQANVPPSTPLAAVSYSDFPLPLTRDSILEHKRAVKNLSRWELETLRAMSRGDEDPLRHERYTVHFPFKGRGQDEKENIRTFLKEVGIEYTIAVYQSEKAYRDPGWKVFAEVGEVVFRARAGVGGFINTSLYFIPFPFFRIWFIKRPGPKVEVYKLHGEL
jgi:hypothetical protein